MVNTLINVSSYKDAPPARLLKANPDRTISKRPLYKKQTVLKLLNFNSDEELGEQDGDSSAAEIIILWTRKCILDSKKYAFSIDDVRDFLREAMLHGTYTGSEWCVNEPNGVWAACDVYEVTVDAWDCSKECFVKMEYYLKFAVGKVGNIILTVSCHPPEDRR